MRLVVFIYSLYLLGLNFVPCGDNLQSKDNFSNSNLIEQTATEFLSHKESQEHNESEHHHELDLCSPFCQCHCCHIHIIQSQNFNYELSVRQNKQQKHRLTQQFLENYQLNLLQPPQV